MPLRPRQPEGRARVAPSEELNIQDIPPEDLERIRAAGRRAERVGSQAWLFPLAFALIVLLKWDSLDEPPFWDTAMGLFPAAITLSASGFDLPRLLAMPGYQEGGPNSYAMSPVTVATAIVLMLAGGVTRALVVLHVLHLLVAALAVVTLFKVARPTLGDVTAGLFCLSVLLHPTFSAQMGSLYMEVVLFLCAVAAIHAWTRRRFWPAVIWGTLAWATKPTGAIVPAALAVATLVERRAARDKMRRVAVLLGLPALWTAGVVVANRIALAGSGDYQLVPSLDTTFGGLVQYLGRFLLNVPDLLLYLVIFAVGFVANAGPIYRALREEPMDPLNRKPEQSDLLVMGLAGLIIAFFVLLFLAALPALAGFTIVLPRYYVVVLPFLLLWLGYSMKRLLGRRARGAPAVLFALLAIVFAVNTNGVLYPSDVDTEGPGNDPPLTERSNAYKRLLALQLEAMEALQELPFGVPVYYGHFEHYLFRYPSLGYARGPLSDGHNFGVESLAPLASAEPFPPCVYAFYSYPWLGGDKVRGLIRLPEARPELAAEIVREFRDGRYEMRLVRIRRRDADCPA